MSGISVCIALSGADLGIGRGRALFLQLPDSFPQPREKIVAEVDQIKRLKGLAVGDAIC